PFIGGMARLIELADAINPAIVNPIPGTGNNNIGAVPILRVNRLGVGSTAAVLVVGVNAGMTQLVGDRGAIAVGIVSVADHRIGVRAGRRVMDFDDLVAA